MSLVFPRREKVAEVTDQRVACYQRAYRERRRVRCARKENDVSACLSEVTDGLRSHVLHWMLLPCISFAELFSPFQVEGCLLLAQGKGYYPWLHPSFASRGSSANLLSRLFSCSVWRNFPKQTLTHYFLWQSCLVLHCLQWTERGVDLAVIFHCHISFLYTFSIRWSSHPGLRKRKRIESRVYMHLYPLQAAAGFVGDTLHLGQRRRFSLAF